MLHVFTQANIFSAQIALSNPVRGEHTWYIFPCGWIKTADWCYISSDSNDIWFCEISKSEIYKQMELLIDLNMTS